MQLLASHSVPSKNVLGWAPDLRPIHPVFVLSRLYPSCALISNYKICIKYFGFLRKLHAVFHNGYTNLCFSQKNIRVPLSPQAHLDIILRLCLQCVPFLWACTHLLFLTAPFLLGMPSPRKPAQVGYGIQPGCSGLWPSVLHSQLRPQLLCKISESSDPRFCIFQSLSSIVRVASISP